MNERQKECRTVHCIPVMSFSQLDDVKKYGGYFLTSLTGKQRCFRWHHVSALLPVFVVFPLHKVMIMGGTQSVKVT